MDPRLIVLLGGVYTEEAEDEDKDERRIEGEGNGLGFRSKFLYFRV